MGTQNSPFVPPCSQRAVAAAARAQPSSVCSPPPSLACTPTSQPTAAGWQQLKSQRRCRASCRHRHQVGRYTATVGPSLSQPASLGRTFGRWRGRGRARERGIARERDPKHRRPPCRWPSALRRHRRRRRWHTVVVCYGRASSLARLSGDVVDDGATPRRTEERRKEPKRTARAEEAW